MRVALNVSIIVLTLGWHPFAALAQTQLPQEDPRTPGWIFTPGIRVGGGWDDNILLTGSATDGPSDYATPLNPSATLEYRGRRTLLSSGYDGSFLMYRSFDELNSSDHRVRGMLTHHATRSLTLLTEADWMRVPTTDSLVLSGIPFFRVGSQLISVGGGFESLLSKATSLRAKYNHRIVDFDDEEFATTSLLGGHEHEALIGFGRALSARLSIGAEYEIRLADIKDTSDGFDSHTGSMTVQYTLTPETTVSGAAGISRLGAGFGHEPKIGPAVRAAITHRARRLIMSASYQRSFIPAYGFGGTFQNEEWGATVQVPFARSRAYVEGSISRFDNDPLEEGQPSLRSVWIAGIAGYRVTRWLSFEGFYNQSNQNTQRAGGDLGRHQVGFRLRAEKPLKLH